MADFTLDQRLENDSVVIGDLTLCQLRLHKNGAFPWVMLIPKRDNIVEILDLTDDDQDILWNEIIFVSTIMKKLFKPTKLNVANLGNIVPQLHVHVVARYSDDKAWPGPIWNSGVKRDYELDEAEALIKQLKAAFAL